jgi:hypothetical protein
VIFTVLDFHITALAHDTSPSCLGVQGAEELESLSEDARMLMSDKDALLNTMQTSHDTHTCKLDAVEDTLLNQEASRLSSLISQYTEWAHNRCVFALPLSHCACSYLQWTHQDLALLLALQLADAPSMDSLVGQSSRQ